MSDVMTDLDLVELLASVGFDGSHRLDRVCQDPEHEAELAQLRYENEQLEDACDAKDDVIRVLERDKSILEDRLKLIKESAGGDD